jgi:hypothetical protein
MEGFIEFILIAVTLIVAITGVLSNPTNKIKGVIIGLAVITSIGTTIKTISTSKESEINKKLVISLVQASNPPAYFSHDLVKVISPLIEKDNMFVSGQTVFEESGERIFTMKNADSKTENTLGLLYLSKRDMNPIFYAYATDGDIQKEVELKLQNKWTDCKSHWNNCLNELSAISKMALEIAPIEIDQTTSSMDSDTLTFSIYTQDLYQGKPIEIILDKRFITGLYGLPPVERGIKILEEGQSYVINKL